MDNPPLLIERLTDAAQSWADASEKSLAFLGRTVVNDGGFFSRIGETRNTTAATLTTFARFFADAANWPEGVASGVAIDFVHRVDGSSTPAILSGGECGPSASQQVMR